MDTGILDLAAFLDEKETSFAAGTNKTIKIREELIALLRKHNKVIIDFGSITRLTPSFAYEVFGKVFDVFKEDVFTKIDFQNDGNDLKERVLDAMRRREKISLAKG